MMRIFYSSKVLFTVFCSLFFVTKFVSAQNSWSAKLEPQRAFIENKGQFSVLPNADFSTDVKFAFDGSTEDYYFSPSGLVIVLSKLSPREKSDEEKKWRSERKKQGFYSLKDWQDFEKKGNRLNLETDELYASWLNANPNVEIVPELKNDFTHSYSFYDKNHKLTDVANIASYKKLTYKNIYPNIDVVYEFHPQTGLKYSVVVHPGGDISQVKLNYSKPFVLTADGKILTSTKFGDIIDHQPHTFYANQTSSVIHSAYKVNGSVISFEVANYDHSRTLVIDPWTQAPAFNTNWDCVWEVETDALGNSYLIGGVMPLQLLKYNNAGALQWTYSTPYDTTSWLGTFATDNLGNSYVTNGSTAAIIKVTTAGVLAWNNPSPGGLFTLTEFWNIAFNCDQTRLIIGGTGGSLNPEPYVYDMNVNTGNVISSQQVTGPGALFGFPPNTNEVRAITATSNQKYYFLTHDSIGYVSQNLSLCPNSSGPFHVENGGYNLSYKCENWRYNNSGIEALAYYNGFVYVNRGNRLDKRDFATAAIVQSVTIPGGGWTASLGQNAVQNSGIAIDDCGNIFVGSITGVYKFNQALTQTGFYATTFNVYDVAITSTGEVVAGGSTGNSGSSTRTGTIQSFAAAACAQPATICCNPTICPVPAMCSNASPITLSTDTPGGTWTPTPGLNTTTGVFNPAVAGVGTHTITYTLACGSYSITITVNNCTPMSVCSETNGNWTVSGGTGPYNWYSWSPGGSTPITTQAQCTACNSSYTWFFGQCLNGATPVNNCVTPAGWVLIGTGTTIPAPTAFPVQVVDNTGQIYSIASAGAVTPCTATTCTVTNSQTNVTCFGGATGTATATATGGSGTYTYSWNTTPVQTTATATGLTAGTYTCTVNDGAGCTQTTTVTITQPTAITITQTNNTPAACGSSNGSATVSASGGTGAITFSWNTSPVQTGPTASGLAAGSYIVTATDANGCTQTLSITIANTGGPTTSISSQTNVLCNGASTGSATIAVSGGTTPYGFSWSPSGGNGATATGLTAGVYTVTVTDAGGCVATQTVTITQPAALTLTQTSNTPATCGANNGSATVSGSGGTGTITYSWNSTPVQTGATATNLGAGSYTVTATDANGCTQTLAVTITSSGGATTSISSQTNVTCNGGTNGSATALATGGTTPYTYSWSPSGGSGVTASNLAAGTYTVTVTDGSGCVSTATATITQPTAITVSTSSTDATCGMSDGSVTATASGGTGTLSYSWSTSPVQTSATATGIPSGTYTVTVTDGNGCTATGTTTVNNTGAPTISLTSQTNTTCFGDTDGSATVSASGGNGTLTYSWNTVPAQTGTTASNLGAGTYTATVTDGVGCSATVSVTITSPAVLGGTTTTTSANCGASDGSATATITGGTGPYTYAWSSGGTAATENNLAAGNYTLDITDANGCTATLSTTVNSVSTASIFAGADVYITEGSSTVLNATGGVSYVWSPATGLSCTNCQSPVASPTTTTVYIVTGTDASGCVGTDTVIVYVDKACGDVFVPNAFSPNLDGSNEELCVFGDCISKLNFQLFNRWGEKVFETTNNSLCWDGTYKGKPLNPDVFYYYLEATLINGENVTLKGNISLVK